MSANKAGVDFTERFQLVDQPEKIPRFDQQALTVDCLREDDFVYAGEDGLDSPEFGPKRRKKNDRQGLDIYSALSAASTG